MISGSTGTTDCRGAEARDSLVARLAAAFDQNLSIPVV
jgi:hypothetical protein